MTKCTVVTHARNFHVDEVMAIALLQIYAIEGNYELIRTRDESIIKKHQANENSFVIDVGFKYDADSKCFDHHQKDFNLKWDSKVPYSSCGLVWKWLVDSKILHQKMNKDMMKLIEDNLIRKIDAHDNGVEPWREGLFITMYNRNHHDDRVMNKQFDRALRAAVDYYHNLFSMLKNDVAETKGISKEIEKSTHKNIVVFKKNYKDAAAVVSETTDKQLVVLPHSKNKWIIKSVPKSRKDNFSLKCPMPKHWRGLKEKALREVSEVEGLIFCHASGFMCIYEGDENSVVNLAEKIVLFNQHFA